MSHRSAAACTLEPCLHHPYPRQSLGSWRQCLRCALSCASLSRLWEPGAGSLCRGRGVIVLFPLPLPRPLPELLPLAQRCPGLRPPTAAPGVGKERWPRGGRGALLPEVVLHPAPAGHPQRPAHPGEGVTAVWGGVGAHGDALGLQTGSRVAGNLAFWARKTQLSLESLQSCPHIQ